MITFDYLKLINMSNKINQTGENINRKSTSVLINLILLSGVSILILTLLYMLFHLDISDKIIYRCLPGFVIGLSSIILYGFLSAGKSKNKSKIHFNH
jgi:hypothetical protein